MNDLIGLSLSLSSAASSLPLGALLSREIMDMIAFLPIARSSRV